MEPFDPVAAARAEASTWLAEANRVIAVAHESHCRLEEAQTWLTKATDMANSQIFSSASIYAQYAVSAANESIAEVQRYRDQLASLAAQTKQLGATRKDLLKEVTTLLVAAKDALASGSLDDVRESLAQADSLVRSSYAAESFESPTMAGARPGSVFTTCPACGNLTQADWSACQYCGTPLAAHGPPVAVFARGSSMMAAGSIADSEEERPTLGLLQLAATFPCPGCGEQVEEGWNACPDCGANLRPPPVEAPGDAPEQEEVPPTQAPPWEPPSLEPAQQPISLSEETPSWEVLQPSSMAIPSADPVWQTGPQPADQEDPRSGTSQGADDPAFRLHDERRPLEALDPGPQGQLPIAAARVVEPPWDPLVAALPGTTQETGGVGGWGEAALEAAPASEDATPTAEASSDDLLARLLAEGGSDPDESEPAPSAGSLGGFAFVEEADEDDGSTLALERAMTQLGSAHQELDDEPSLPPPSPPASAIEAGTARITTAPEQGPATCRACGEELEPEFAFCPVCKVPT